MMINKGNETIKLEIILYVLVWALVNLLFLEQFPFFHSDEIWLAGLTREILSAGSMMVTESFFDLLPRTVHGLRILYHGFNGIFLKITGFTPLGIRTLSLFSGALVLLLFFRYLRLAGFSFRRAAFGMLLLSLDIQFIYASHFGRQEMVLLVFVLSALNCLAGGRILTAGLLTGLAAGIHPNAFITAWPVSLILLAGILQKESRVRGGFTFLISAGGAAGFFAALSLFMNPDVWAEYRAFGASVGVRSGFAARFSDFLPFFKKLFFQISGTYYTPDIRPQLILFPVFSGTAFLLLLWWGRRLSEPVQKTMRSGFLGMIGIAAGILIVGKYSQPSVLFFFPFFYLLLVSFIALAVEGIVSLAEDRKWTRWGRPAAMIAGAVIVLLFFFFSGTQIVKETRREGAEFFKYNRATAELVPPGSRVLANINAGIGLKDSRYYDWRNLAFLNGEAVADYIVSRGIDYILFPEELEYIYNSRPVWNIMYGNLYPWYEPLKVFLKESCEPVGSFSSPGYGIRITSLRYSKEWDVTVYRILSPSISE